MTDCFADGSVGGKEGTIGSVPPSGDTHAAQSGRECGYCPSSVVDFMDGK